MLSKKEFRKALECNDNIEKLYWAILLLCDKIKSLDESQDMSQLYALIMVDTSYKLTPDQEAYARTLKIHE